ncbi:hypothetical protein OPV22_024579 [Ensete ventricosum]|uniref:Uncharacterized protein n=1 Tax=Ensete ventricosum TaxID=4639 RepID=A0AAV8P6I8_ENSVE|nr:hypothetical protein OPV22_024579 [Ensete ventricosum]
MTVNLSSFKLRLQRVQELLGNHMDAVSFNLTTALHPSNSLIRERDKKKRWGFTILVAFAGSDHHTDEIAASYDRKVPTDLFATLHQMDNIRTADLDLGPMASLDDSEVLYSFLRKTHAANWHKVFQVKKSFTPTLDFLSLFLLI